MLLTLTILKMEKIRVMFDKEGNTLDVWFEEPRKAVCEETGDEVILKKDIKTGRVIGFEKVNYYGFRSAQPVASR